LVETCRQLGDELIKAWYAHDLVPTDIPPDEDEVLYARRMVAQRCLYGVDKNIMAVDLAKLSLWLVTLAKDHPFTFLDHALRHGDSLVGLTRKQIIGFHWEPKQQQKFGEELIQKRLDKATEARAKILSAREDVPYRDQEQRMQLANDALDLIRLLGNACVSCFFAADKKKAREDEVKRVFGLASSYLGSLSASNVDFTSRNAIQVAAIRLDDPPHPIPAFHWEIEFPEVFSRENGGFDAFVGNPPFLGGKRISTVNGGPYRDWLADLHIESSSNADLVAHFFRRAFDLVRKCGGFGLIATNTIAQGDTRHSGLRWICENNGEIYQARRRLKWPGHAAAVVVSVIHVFKGISGVPRFLDGESVNVITAFLFHRGGNDNPKKILENDGQCFIGNYVLGMGFTFDDSTLNATPISEMRSILAEHPNCNEVIFPYIGGEEVNTSPTHRHHRYVINFGARSEAECWEKWPILMKIVESKVKPDRLKVKRRALRERWWQFAEKQPALWRAISQLEEVLVCSLVSNKLQFAFLPKRVVYSHKLGVFARQERAFFGVMQSRLHDVWTRQFSSTMKDDINYSPSDCFDTFPFPKGWNDQTELELPASEYYDFRAALMQNNDEGMTKSYNRFHSPDERDDGILELRRLHSQMDVAVLRAYGWDDLADQAALPDFCQFLLDYEEEDDDSPADSSSTRQKKKPWRYRWPDDFRDEVLARLLELNEQRYREEQLAGKSADKPKKAKKLTSKKSGPTSGPKQSSFLEE
ncbi:MAG: class I SAM-dependent DNA methyltransferase, partial [bacterium]|nr:class I SAM-dependent DNA methyltransferase [bacterium]